MSYFFLVQFWVSVIPFL
uniref:Uncharacterized protein n=1 Tax=Anguilla anguilla TaxID=7936 RepID=A0A0E9S3H3_ANGAN